MSAQDPELSAALGWPGGISDPVPDRKVLLQMVAALRLASQQALEALSLALSDVDWRADSPTQPVIHKAHAALRTALAQQAEPVQEPAFHGFMSDDGTQVDVCFSPSAPRRDGTYATAYYTAPPHRVAQQAEPVEEPVGEVLHDWSTEKECIAGTWAHLNDLGKNLPVGTKLYTAPPQQADPTDPGNDVDVLREHVRHLERRVRELHAQKPEPVQEPVAWLAPRIVDSYSRPDLGYETCSKSDYGAFPAYTAPPQRTMVPLTDEEIDAEWHELDGEASALFKRVIRKFARAVEKAVWEKNNG